MSKSVHSEEKQLRISRRKNTHVMAAQLEFSCTIKINQNSGTSTLGAKTYDSRFGCRLYDKCLGLAALAPITSGTEKFVF